MPQTTSAILTALQNPIGSRHKAAEILHKVAESGSSGNFPDDVSCEQLGAALERICLNSPEPDPLMAVLTGWREAEKLRIARLQGTVAT